MEKRKERLQAIPHPEKSLLSAPEAIHPLSPDVSPTEEIDSVMSIFEEIDIEAVDAPTEEAPLGIDLPKREEEEWEEEAPVAEEPTTGDTSDPVRMYLQEMGEYPPAQSGRRSFHRQGNRSRGKKGQVGTIFFSSRVAFRVITRRETQARRHRTSSCFWRR